MPVIVNVAVRSAPVLAATLNWTVPDPEPDAPWVTVRNAALLTAVHVQPVFVVTAMDADPPAAANVVVVTPVMIWHALGDVEPPDVAELPPQAVAASNSAAEKTTRMRRERRRDSTRVMNTLVKN